LLRYLIEHFPNGDTVDVRGPGTRKSQGESRLKDRNLFFWSGLLLRSFEYRLLPVSRLLENKLITSGWPRVLWCLFRFCGLKKAHATPSMEGLRNLQVSSRLLVEGVPLLALITHADSC
jgi:hypothetical protein